MKLMSVSKSDMPLKKYKAVFCDCAGTTTCKNRYRKAVHFGSKGSTTYVNGADDA